MESVSWKKIRLELAPCLDFPKGSSGRSFLLQVPLDLHSEIDGSAIKRHPEHATVRRFWSSDPDEFGRVVPADGHWLLRCERKRRNVVFRLRLEALQLGNEVTIEEPDGTIRGFLVASVKQLDTAPESQR